MWIWAQLESNRTETTLRFLSLGGFQVYCPRFKEPRRNHGRRVGRVSWLFPAYACVLIVSGWWHARWSPVVLRLIMDGEMPARVPDLLDGEVSAPLALARAPFNARHFTLRNIGHARLASAALRRAMSDHNSI